MRQQGTRSDHRTSSSTSPTNTAAPTAPRRPISALCTVMRVSYSQNGSAAPRAPALDCSLPLSRFFSVADSAACERRSRGISVSRPKGTARGVAAPRNLTTFEPRYPQATNAGASQLRGFPQATSTPSLTSGFGRRRLLLLPVTGQDVSSDLQGSHRASHGLRTGRHRRTRRTSLVLACVRAATRSQSTLPPISMVRASTAAGPRSRRTPSSPAGSAPNLQTPSTRAENTRQSRRGSKQPCRAATARPRRIGPSQGKAADTQQRTTMPRIYFPKIPLVLQSPASLAEMQGANQLVFRTTPAVGKVLTPTLRGLGFGQGRRLHGLPSPAMTRG